MLQIVSAIKTLWSYRLPALILLTLVTGAMLYHRGYSSGVEDVKVKTVSSAIKVRETQNEIRNNRPDTHGLIERLRDGTF